MGGDGLLLGPSNSWWKEAGLPELTLLGVLPLRTDEAGHDGGDRGVAHLVTARVKAPRKDEPAFGPEPFPSVQKASIMVEIGCMIF